MTVALAILGGTQLVVTGPWLIGVDPMGLLGDGASAAHQVRDGAFGVVVGAAALLSMWRNRWAVPSFIIASIALITQALAGLADASIAATGASEGIHILSIAVTCAVGLSAARVTSLGPERPTPLRALDGK